MEIKNYVHEHPLKLICEINNNGQLLCPVCGDPSFGECYSCITCGVYPNTCFACDKEPSGSVYICEQCWPQTPVLHKLCADLPEEIQITYRPGCFFRFKKESNHSEKLDCDFCSQTHREFKYCCEGCDFQIGIGCASKLIQYHEGTHQQQHIKHFSHRHPLAFFRLDDIIICKLCLKNIHDIDQCYGCAPCEFYIHDSCRQFLQEITHPFHPGHFLTLDDVDKSTGLCDACCLHIRGFKYRCEEDNCTFNLHPECTSLKPNIKHNGHHQHLLLFIESRSYRSKCESCGFSTLGNFFIRCVECRLNFHLHCGSRKRIPPRVLHEQHEHPLIPAIHQTLAEKDYSHQLLYCNVCSGERNPEDPFYRCAIECEYYVHIRCAITEVQYRGEGKLKHFIHEHVLILREILDDGDIFCYGCGKLVEGPGYGCDICPFYLHRSCAELPRQIYDHQLHTHYLVLQVRCASPFICNSCDKLSYGFMYECKSCDFYLELDCASKHPSINLTDECESYDEERIGHFSHRHHLTTVLDIVVVNCNLCYKKIDGQSYGCAPCGFYIHISCGELPPETRHPFHPLHYLTLMMPEQLGESSTCYACRLQIQGLTYRCDECNIDLHPECLSLEGNIKYEGHDQHLLTRVEKMSYQFQCNACSLTIEGTFFMRCAECNFDFHEQCGPLPLPPNILNGRPPLTAIVEVHGDKREKIRHFGHEHFLFAREKNNIVYYCCACEEKIAQDKPAYGCDMCMFYLHKSCVDLPTERHHPFHRRPLYLQGRYWGGYRQCKGCFKFYRGFSYSCQVCDFNLDLECSSFEDSSGNLKSVHKHRRIIPVKHKSVHDEQHSLTLFTKLYVTPECNCCKFIPPDKLTPLDSFFVRCFDCKIFNRHFLCCPLPKTIQVPDFHPHPLNLENNFIHLFDGFDDTEFCCDLCETRRDARECVYYCEECSFVADLECLLHEVIHILKQDPEADTLRIPRKENISQEGSEKCLTYKQMLETLTEGEKKSIKQVENEIKQGTLLYFFEELREVNGLVKARITKVLSDNNIDEEVLKSKAIELAQGKMQLTFIDDNEAELVNVHGKYNYKINGEFAPVLNKLLDKYGDVGASCPFTQSLKTMLLIPLCWVLQRMNNNKVMDINGWLIIHWWFILKLVEIGGIRVDFALNHLKRIAAVYFLIDSSKSSPLYNLHQDMAQVSREIDEMKAKFGKLKENFEKLQEEARDKISAHGEGSRSHARLLNDTLGEGLWWKNVSTGLLDDI